MEPVALLALAGLGWFLLRKDEKSDKQQDDGDDAPPYGDPGQAPPPSMQPVAAPPAYPQPMAPMPRMAPPPRVMPRPTPMPLSDELARAATSLYSVASSPASSCAAIASQTAAFQQQAATDGHRINVDGKYGTDTQRLLESVLARQGLHAPGDLWGPGRRCHTSPGAQPPPPGAPAGGANSHAAQLLRDQMGGAIYAADAYLARGDANSAVEAYKAAGQAGVQSVGPAIDAQTRGASMTATRQAWLRNGDLAKINSRQYSNKASTQADAFTARDIAHQMFDLYSRSLGVMPRTATGYAYGTGIGTIIPSTYHQQPKCMDANSNLQVCSQVAAALATETDATRLIEFGKTLITNYPLAAAALIDKGNGIRSRGL